MIGQTTAVLGGPPCETWTAARFLEMLGIKHVPRPIRSSVQSWGLDRLTASEQRFIQLGNVFLRAMTKFMHAACLCNASALMEHPAKPECIPESKLPPSSELLPDLKCLVDKPGVQLYKFHQCMVGAKSRKPISCHFVNMPEVAAEFLKQQNGCLCILGNRNIPRAQKLAHKHEALTGLDANRCFKTAPSKQYPPRRCECMAAGVVNRISKVLHNGEVDWDLFMQSPAAPFFMPLDPYLDAHAWGQYGSDNASSARRQQQHATISQDLCPSGHTGVSRTVNGVEDGCTAVSTQVDPVSPVPSEFLLQECVAMNDLTSPVTQVSPELAVIIAAKRAQAYERRQAKRLQAIRAVPLSIAPQEEGDDNHFKFTVDLPGFTSAESGSTMGNRFRMGKTPAHQARLSTCLAWSTPPAILASEPFDFPADGQTSLQSTPGA